MCLNQMVGNYTDTDYAISTIINNADKLTERLMTKIAKHITIRLLRKTNNFVSGNYNINYINNNKLNHFLN